jgi:phosphotransferase system HPr (HPr) family protein
MAPAGARKPSPEASLEELIPEKAFAGLLEKRAQVFYRLTNTLLQRSDAEWMRSHFYGLISETDTLEAFLDDYGARYNRTFAFFRELVASIRGIALAGFSVAHLERRFESYGTILSPRESEAATASIRRSRAFLLGALRTLLGAAIQEGGAQGLVVPSEGLAEGEQTRETPRQKLPRNTDQEDLEDDEQKIAEVAAKFLQVCGMFDDLAVRRIVDEDERETYLRSVCSEEHARVYEATVHNLQSAYDTWVKNTVIESSDPRLSKLRGHASAALHLLEAVTHLVHFVERHESGLRNEAIEQRLAALVDRGQVRDYTLNHILHWAAQIVRRGRPLAEDLLPSYTNVQLLEVTLGDDVSLHARPAALIVGIVNRYGTPVEMEIEGRKCNAASILDLMVAVGSHPHARRFRFRGDEKPLRDIELLFRSGLGEKGIDRLPGDLAYLRSGP